MRTGNPYRIPPRLDQCEHCAWIFFTPMESAFCVVSTDFRGEQHQHLCATHALQVKRLAPFGHTVISHFEEIPISRLAEQK